MVVVVPHRVVSDQDGGAAGGLDAVAVVQEDPVVERPAIVGEIGEVDALVLAVPDRETLDRHIGPARDIEAVGTSPHLGPMRAGISAAGVDVESLSGHVGEASRRQRGGGIGRNREPLVVGEHLQRRPAHARGAPYIARELGPLRERGEVVGPVDDDAEVGALDDEPAGRSARAGNRHLLAIGGRPDVDGGAGPVLGGDGRRDGAVGLRRASGTGVRARGVVTVHIEGAGRACARRRQQTQTENQGKPWKGSPRSRMAPSRAWSEERRSHGGRHHSEASQRTNVRALSATGQAAGGSNGADAHPASNGGGT